MELTHGRRVFLMWGGDTFLAGGVGVLPQNILKIDSISRILVFHTQNISLFLCFSLELACAVFQYPYSYYLV